MNTAPATVSPSPASSPPAQAPLDSATFAAWDQHFRQVADWTATAFMALLQYDGQNTDFREHFVIFPGIRLKAGYKGAGMPDNGLDPAAIKTPDDLKAWLADCIVASPNLPDQNLAPAVIAMRERAIAWALQRTKSAYLAKDLAQPGSWTSRMGTAIAQTSTGIAG